MDETKEPTVGASLGTTINIGNYESQRIDIGLWGVPYDASPEKLEELIPTAKLTIHNIVEGLAEELGRRLKEDFGK